MLRSKAPPSAQICASKLTLRDYYLTSDTVLSLSLSLSSLLNNTHKMYIALVPKRSNMDIDKVANIKKLNHECM